MTFSPKTIIEQNPYCALSIAALAAFITSSAFGIGIEHICNTLSERTTCSCQVCGAKGIGFE